MKKILALVLALTMVLAFAPLSFAATDNPDVVGQNTLHNFVLTPAGYTGGSDPVVSSVFGGGSLEWISKAKQTPSVTVNVDFSKLQNVSSTVTTEADFWATYGKEFNVELGGFAAPIDAALTATASGGVYVANDIDELASLEYRVNGGSWQSIAVDDWDYTAYTPTDGDLTGDSLQFAISVSRAATVKYDVRLTTGKEPNASNANLNDYYVQTVSFEIKFNAAGKPVKDLKITSLKSTDYDVHLVDGVWFVDTTDSKFNLATFSSNEFTVGVAKNDGSSFTNKAVYTIIGYTQDTKSGDRNYLSYGVDGSDAVDAKELDYDKQTTQKGTIPLIIPGTTIGNITDTNPAKTWNQAYLNSQSDLKIPHEIWIQVETEDAIYRAKAYFVLRTSIVARNPEGVYFKDRTITLAVNQVLFPAYVTNVDPLKDISSDVELFYTDNADRNIYSIVKKDGKYSLIGMKEGTSYVSLSYSWKGASSPTAPILYGDTAKIVVSGITPIEPGTKYVVTASRLNVRKSAGTGSAIVTTYAKGTVVEVVEIKDGWAKLSTGNYVSAQYLIKYSSSTVIGTKSVTARTLNVRAGAGTSYAIVGKLTRGSKVDVVEIVAGGAWAKINYAGSTYYVSTSYLA